ncbi:MAG: hypothetical protein HY080_17705 [Gammaproteobacteria bacterium]|nr:hypothetical protein [Gammaproteobacteria bacterium]
MSIDPKYKKYLGIFNDTYGGMSDTGKIIRDAWAFGLLAETETCEGWTAQGIEELWRKVNLEWEKYQFSVGKLPPALQEKYLSIQAASVNRAKAAGWNPDLGDDD